MSVENTWMQNWAWTPRKRSLKVRFGTRAGAPVLNNEIAWSLDHTTMDPIDAPTRRATAFDDAAIKGQTENPRMVITVPPEPGKPGGMTIDP
jgi:sugar lactone lactonase YvrE